MLSAAHVLAMDAKNLLDVVDSVRLRYPNVFPSNTTKQPDEPNQSTPRKCQNVAATDHSPIFRTWHIV